MFEFVKNDNGNAAPMIKEKEATAATYKVGDALVLDAGTGLLKLCTGTTKPHFISAASKEVTADDAILAVNPVYPEQEWKTTFSADASVLNVGAAVTIAENGNEATATTNNGIFTIVEKLGTGAVGTEVIGKFL